MVAPYLITGPVHLKLVQAMVGTFFDIHGWICEPYLFCISDIFRL